MRRVYVFSVDADFLFEHLSGHSRDKSWIYLTRVFLSLFARDILMYYILKAQIRPTEMNTKLTLTIEESIIEKAKLYAKGENRSLSDLISNYLKVITANENEFEVPITPLVQSLKGSFTEPKDFDYKKELSEALSKKYV